MNQFLWSFTRNIKSSFQYSIKYKCRKTSKACPPPAAVKSLQSCPTLCDPRDSIPPGSPVQVLNKQAFSSDNPQLTLLYLRDHPTIPVSKD